MGRRGSRALLRALSGHCVLAHEARRVAHGRDARARDRSARIRGSVADRRHVVQESAEAARSMKHVWKGVACFVGGIVSCALFCFIFLGLGRSTRLTDLVDRIRATTVADYADRLIFIRSSARLVAGGKAEVSALKRDLERFAQADRDRQAAEDSRRRGEEERARRLGESVQSAVQQSSDLTGLLDSAIDAYRQFRGQ